MADLRIWKPWYKRIPGAALVATGTALVIVGFVLSIPFFIGAGLISYGTELMRKPFPDYDDWEPGLYDADDDADAWD